MPTSLRRTRFSLQSLRTITLSYACYPCAYSGHTSFECTTASKQKRTFVHFRCTFLPIQVALRCSEALGSLVNRRSLSLEDNVEVKYVLELARL